MSNNEVITKAEAARKAASEMARVSATMRNNALLALADALQAQSGTVIAANSLDIAEAQAKSTPEPLVDRLLLNEERIIDIACALRQLALAADPIGIITEGRVLYNGIRMKRVRVPLGVVAMIYEARPNVTADAAGLTLKTANVCLLRGGSLANNTNIAMTKVLYNAGIAAGLPTNWLQSIETTDRSATNDLMQQHGLIDVLVPRGSGTLIRNCIENSKVPVIETGEGNCHIYVHSAARQDIVVPIIINAKTQRPGVCNACESVLIDTEVAEQFVAPIAKALFAHGVKIHADRTAFALAQTVVDGFADLLVEASEDDWGREYLDLEISIKCINNVDEAIAHVNRYSTHHSESILSEDYLAVSRFLEQVDSAAVYSNASTRFTDGGEFGLGAEIGISTQKLHARGPMGLDALTSTKFILEGDGQIR